MSGLFETDTDLIEMRQPFKQDFFDLFNEAYSAYENGDWVKARELLERVESVK